MLCCCCLCCRSRRPLWNDSLAHQQRRFVRPTTNRCFTPVRECVNFSTFSTSSHPPPTRIFLPTEPHYICLIPFVTFFAASFTHLFKVSPMLRGGHALLILFVWTLGATWKIRKSTIYYRSKTTVSTLHIAEIFTHFAPLARAHTPPVRCRRSCFLPHSSPRLSCSSTDRPTHTLFFLSLSVTYCH